MLKSTWPWMCLLGDDVCEAAGCVLKCFCYWSCWRLWGMCERHACIVCALVLVFVSFCRCLLLVMLLNRENLSWTGTIPFWGFVGVDLVESLSLVRYAPEQGESVLNRDQSFCVVCVCRGFCACCGWCSCAGCRYAEQGRFLIWSPDLLRDEFGVDNVLQEVMWSFDDLHVFF